VAAACQILNNNGRCSPALGQDSAEVLHNWLGTGANEIEGFRRDGII
jgi:hypothetical protein